MNHSTCLRVIAALLAGCCLGAAAFAAGTGEKAPAASKITLAFWHHYNAQSPENKTLNEVLIRAKRLWLRDCAYRPCEQSSLRGAALLAKEYLHKH